MKVQPYLFFDGRCEEAAEFYKKALGAKTQMMMRNKESPEPHGSPAMSEKILHMRMRIGDTIILMSDGHSEGNPKFEGFALSVTVGSDAEAQRQFAALSEGGKVRMPMGKTFFSSNFGMVTDRFGVMWMVYVEPAEAR
jgi:PhnB protein